MSSRTSRTSRANARDQTKHVAFLDETILDLASQLSSAQREIHTLRLQLRAANTVDLTGASEDDVIDLSNDEDMPPLEFPSSAPPSPAASGFLPHVASDAETQIYEDEPMEDVFGAIVALPMDVGVRYHCDVWTESSESRRCPRVFGAHYWRVTCFECDNDESNEFVVCEKHVADGVGYIDCPRCGDPVIFSPDTIDRVADEYSAIVAERERITRITVEARQALLREWRA